MATRQMKGLAGKLLAGALQNPPRQRQLAGSDIPGALPPEEGTGGHAGLPYFATRRRGLRGIVRTKRDVDDKATRLCRLPRPSRSRVSRPPEFPDFGDVTFATDSVYFPFRGRPEAMTGI